MVKELGFMKLQYFLIVVFIVMLLVGIAQGDFLETWMNGATL
jgi:hypothetical protein